MSIPLYKSTSHEKFEDAKYGMFIHWGLYAIIERGEWVKFNENIPHEEYEKLRDKFNPVNYSAEKWAGLMKKAGLKYVVVTARHHDGFSMFETKQFPEWSIMNTPYGKDMMKPLVEACRKNGIMFFFYYSLLDWTREDYKNDFYSYLSFMNKQLAELCENYGRIDGIWFDGVNFIIDWEKWDFDNLIKTIRIRQPHALICINQAFLSEGNRITVHGDVDFITYEKHGIRPLYQAGPKYLARECCTTIGEDAWGYHSEEKCITYKESLHGLVTNVCKGGNFLLNTGPDETGSVPQAHIERYLEIGKWLENNGESVYGVRPSGLGIRKWGGAVVKENSIYFYIWEMPEDKIISIERPDRKLKSLCALTGCVKIPFTIKDFEVEINLLHIDSSEPVLVLKGDLDGEPEWFKIECEDYVSGGHEFHHHPITHTPLCKCYRHDDIGCQCIEEEPNGVAMLARKGISYLYNVKIPGKGRMDVYLRAKDVVDNRATKEELKVSVRKNGKEVIKQKKIRLKIDSFSYVSLGQIDFTDDECFLALNIESGCGLIDFIKIVYC
ncbi:MAG: alpha-L-fucosidase [Phycisphaerales bacterium]